MNCPNHPDRRLVKNGTTAIGSQRYRCTACNYSMTDSDNTQGPPCYGDVKRTNAEHQAAYRRRKVWRDAIAEAETKQGKQGDSMKIYSYCAIGNDKSNTTRVLSGMGAFSSENVSRKYVTDNFFTTYGFYPQHVEISSVRRPLLQTLLNSICEDED